MNITSRDHKPTNLTSVVVHTSSRNRYPTQCVQHLRLTQDPDQEYFLYLPNTSLSEAPVLTCIHGVSRNAEEQIRSFMAYAEANGVIIVAPLFDTERFPDYQRLGRPVRGQRADLILQKILQDVACRINVAIQQIFMFGFSGGAQFAHRYMMAYPRQVNAVVLAAADWYTFPDEKYRYPRGIERSDKFTGIPFDLKQFLQIPVCVLVGEHDVVRDATLRSIEHQQGLNRRERAVCWTKAMRTAAKLYDYDTHFYFELLPETGHSFSTAMAAGDMGERAFRFLFPTQRNCYGG